MARKRRLTVHHVLPGLLLAFTLCVFAPVDLYCSNADEFWFALGDLAPGLLLAALAVFLLVTAAAVFLPPRASVAFRAVVYAVSFLAYLQGNLLVIDYGTLNGRQIDWQAYTLRYVLDALLWAAVIALFIFLMFRFRKKFRRIVEAAACVLLVTQVVSLGVFFVQGRAGRGQEANAYLSREGEFTLSEKDNTVVFLLDAFDSHLMADLLESGPDRIGELLPDFTFYPDTVGGAGRTRYAIPYIFSGDTNRDPQSYAEYIARAYAASPLMSELASGRYDSRIFSVSHYVDCTRSDAIDNAESGIPKPASRLGLAKQFMKLVAFRYLPSAASRFFWMYTGDFEKLKSTDVKAEYALDDETFHRALEEEGLTPVAEPAAFRFYHLHGPHEPYTMDEGGWKSETGETTEEIQAIGSLKIVADYLDKMKAMGLYDRAAVIVMADHGFSAHSSVEQTPLFMVKLPGESHPFAVSDLPLSYASLPEILTAAVKQELASLEPWRWTGTRYYYRYYEQDYMVYIAEYAVNGPALETEPVATGVAYHEDTQRGSRDYPLGTKLWFDDRGTARNYIVSGFSWNEGDFTWTDGNDAELQFELGEPPGALELVLEHGTFNGNQTVEVYVNDEQVALYVANGKTEHKVVIPEGTVTGTELRLRLHLPDACAPNTLYTSTDSRLLALSMNSLEVRKKK